MCWGTEATMVGENNSRFYGAPLSAYISEIQTLDHPCLDIAVSRVCVPGCLLAAT